MGDDGSNLAVAGHTAASLSTAIDSSNIGFKLLKKSGWQEGTGLGVSQQGRLEPIEPQVKNNKRGIGAEKVKKDAISVKKVSSTQEKAARKRARRDANRLRKKMEEEKRMQEKEVEKAFYREFWPENV